VHNDFSPTTHGSITELCRACCNAKISVRDQEIFKNLIHCGATECFLTTSGHT